jgi:hypothetical protein
MTGSDGLTALSVNFSKHKMSFYIGKLCKMPSTHHTHHEWILF